MTSLQLNTCPMLALTGVLLFSPSVPCLLQAQDDATPTKTIKVLWIGNSYTSRIRKTFLGILKDSPYKDSTFEFITKGGAQLVEHCKNKAVLEKISAGGWDYIILQDQSQTPALPGSYSAGFHESVKDFSKLAKKGGAQTVLYMTWGRRDGDNTNRHLFPTYEKMQAALTDAYESAARKTRSVVAPVGNVWARVRKQDDELGKLLYSQDGSHPGPAGAFLVSCVFMRVLFNDSLAGVTGNLEPAQEKLIKEAVLKELK